MMKHTVSKSTLAKMGGGGVSGHQEARRVLPAGPLTPGHQEARPLGLPAGSWHLYLCYAGHQEARSELPAGSYILQFKRIQLIYDRNSAIGSLPVG
jgi:hypothetical protein